MMHKILTLSFLLTLLISKALSQAQPAGEYYLEGVMETASGFKLNKDSTFDFFYSYGALDRQGAGTWKLKNDSIIFNSKPYPGKDFKLVNESASTNKFSILKLEGANSTIYQLMYCAIQNSAKDTLVRFDADGLAVLPFAADSVILLSKLCAERSSSFPLKAATDYTFHFEPWITEVFFNDYTLRFKEDYLEGRHPLMDDKIYRFNKEK